MQTGWIEPWDDIWYYADASGALFSGWQQIGGTWYYFDEYGYMLHDTWKDGYYLNESGTWVTTPSYAGW